MGLKFGLPKLRGQGPTKYLVLLAIVLIIALVSLAILSFSPGNSLDEKLTQSKMDSENSLDEKLTQSKMYWSSASPIAIVDWEAKAWNGFSIASPYLKIKNTGVYPIRITGIIGADGGKATYFWTNHVNPAICPGPVTTYGWYPNISDYYYLAPGEEKYFGWSESKLVGIPCNYRILFYNLSSRGDFVGGASSVCENSATNPGVLEVRNFGFEYIEYVDGKEITKTQIGSVPLMIKCLPPAKMDSGNSLDAKLTQSKMYWSSASPIAIVDWGARVSSGNGLTFPYLKIKNTGVYPIRIIGIIGGDAGEATTFYTNLVNPAICPGPTGSWSSSTISDYYYLAPGEEKYFGWTGFSGIPCDYLIWFLKSFSVGSLVGGATSLCENSATNPGIVEFKTFGFEYIEYVDGKEITKAQIGSVPLMIKCLPPA